MRVRNSSKNELRITFKHNLIRREIMRKLASIQASPSLCNERIIQRRVVSPSMMDRAIQRSTNCCNECHVALNGSIKINFPNSKIWRIPQDIKRSVNFRLGSNMFRCTSAQTSNHNKGVMRDAWVNQFIPCEPNNIENQGSLEDNVSDRSMMKI